MGEKKDKIESLFEKVTSGKITDTVVNLLFKRLRAVLKTNTRGQRKKTGGAHEIGEFPVKDKTRTEMFG